VYTKKITCGTRGLWIRFTRRAEVCYNPDIEHPWPKDILPPDITVKTSAHFPAPAYREQDAVFGPAFAVLEQAIRGRAFPAASIAVTHNGKLAALRAFGRFTYEPDSPEVTPSSIFDLASLSKAVATTSMAMILYERGLVDLEAPVIAIVPEFAGDDLRRGSVTLHMLLAHSSGLPGHEKLFLRAHSRDECLAAALAVPLTANPGMRTEYSDIGFIILGVALERIADEPLDRFCQREVFGPAGMARTAFNPPSEWRAFTPPSADDRTFRGRIIQGEVQDENASALGGVAGHAGLFSTAEDLAIFADAMLHGGEPEARRRRSGLPVISHILGADILPPLAQPART
jgi:CubicO group peptidase (beta-lactamase class C family)